MIIGGYILKASHYLKAVSDTPEGQNKAKDKDIHKKIHAAGSVRAKRSDDDELDHSRTILTADGRLIKNSDFDNEEFKKQMILMAKILLIEVIIFIAKFNWEARSPTARQSELRTSTGEVVVVDYVVCESENSMLFVISWCYTAFLLGFAMYKTSLAEKTGLVPDSHSMHGLVTHCFGSSFT